MRLKANRTAAQPAKESTTGDSDGLKIADNPGEQAMVYPKETLKASLRSVWQSQNTQRSNIWQREADRLHQLRGRIHKPDLSESKFHDFLMSTETISDLRKLMQTLDLTYAELLAKANTKLQQLLREKANGAALAMLVYCRGSIRQKRYSHVRPKVKVIEERLYIQYDDSEKKKRTTKSETLCLIPVLLDIEKENLRDLMTTSNKEIADGLKSLTGWYAELGFERSVKSARKMQATLLFHYLTHCEAGKSLAKVARQAHLTLINYALGHSLASNQWATYLYSCAQAASSP
eukprot:m.316349 g.316349  ORF g.316349 m.316349 type:complete len:290 (-) comp46204_c0_seq1:103-972(-)